MRFRKGGRKKGKNDIIFVLGKKRVSAQTPPNLLASFPCAHSTTQLERTSQGEKGSLQQGPGDPERISVFPCLHWDGKSRVPSLKEGQEWGQQEGLAVHRADAIPRT